MWQSSELLGKTKVFGEARYMIDHRETTMPLSHQISSPREPGQYEGRKADCTAALRPLVANIATAEPEALVAALNGNMNSLEKDTALALVIKAAKSAGWGSEEIGPAVMRLAREYEGAKGAIFD
jgi:hypothetical protein